MLMRTRIGKRGRTNKYDSIKGLIADFKFLVTVFHCSQTTALPQAFLSYVIPSYGVTSYVVVGHGWLVLGYTAVVSYWLGFFALSVFGGVYSVETHHALWAEDGKPVLSHEL